MTHRTHAEIPTLKEALKHLARLAVLIRPFWWQIFRGLVLGLILGLLGLASPLLTKLLIDEVYPARDVSLLHVVLGGMFTLSMTSMLAGAVHGYYTTYISTRLGNATGLLFFNHLQHLTVRFYDQHRVGEIMSRFSDLRSSISTLSGLFSTLLTNGIYLVLVPPLLLLLNWKLALASLVVVPVTSLISVLTSRVLRHYWKRSAEASAELNAFQVEVLSHIRTLRVMSIEHDIFARARRETLSIAEIQIAVAGMSQLVGIATSTLRASGGIFVTWLGWTLILRGELTLGGYMAFMAYSGYLTRPVTAFAGVFNSLQQGAVSLGRLFEYLDAPVEQDPSLSYRPLPPVRRHIVGEMCMHKVSFGYSNEVNVLHEVELRLGSGRVTAIVGESGAGKSTLLRLLSRMEQPTAGEITVDGIPLTQISLGDLRRQMAVVWQEYSVMQGTIWENLTWGNAHAARDDVDKAVRMCRLDDLVRSLPDGYDAPVAEWGATLSGGQRQRLSIARALIRGAPVLLLDEATSQIDMKTELEILRGLFQSREQRTVVFVTHRVATAALADCIVVMEKGSVVATGTHDELLKSCSTYRALHGATPVSSEARAFRIMT